MYTTYSYTDGNTHSVPLKTHRPQPYCKHLPACTVAHTHSYLYYWFFSGWHLINTFTHINTLYTCTHTHCTHAYTCAYTHIVFLSFNPQTFATGTIAIQNRYNDSAKFWHDFGIHRFSASIPECVRWNKQVHVLQTEIFKYLKRRHNIPVAELKVLTQYNAQRHDIYKKLKNLWTTESRLFERDDVKTLDVSTVVSSQGQLS